MKSSLLDSSDSEQDDPPVDLLLAQHTALPRWSEDPLKGVKFIDDMTGHEKCNIALGFFTISMAKENRLLWARQSESYFQNIRTNCDLRGMKVNDLKTQLLCLTSAINYDVRSFIRLPDGQLTSGDTLKVVGFTFGQRPGPAEHIKALRCSYGARAWVLRHLKRIGMEQKLLVRVYCELIRPIFE